MSVCDVARRYVQLIQEGRYDEIGALWAEDAVFHTPHGTVLRGRETIGAFYARFLRSITPDVRAARFAADEAQRVCVLELETRMRRRGSGDWVTDPQAAFALSAIDRMTIDGEGRIKHMIVYLAPENRWMEEGQ